MNELKYINKYEKYLIELFLFKNNLFFYFYYNSVI
jgi:hypothetical protein